MRLLLLAGLALAATGCLDEVDPPWQLDHDRVVAVRATPPGLASGEQATIDGLTAHEGAATAEEVPLVATVIAPDSLADLLARDGDAWVVTAPDGARLAAARAELGLAADAPVPLQLAVGFAGDLAALKIVDLGVHADNPTLGAIQIDGGSPPAEVVVGREVDVPLQIDIDQDTEKVNWLTSVGTLHDFDLPRARIFVEPDNPLDVGELAVVVRDDHGGVAWQVWPIRVE